MPDIYVNPKIKFNRENNDNWFVEANDFIKEGELLLIEEIYPTNHETWHYIVMSNEKIFDSLYPRTIKWKVEDVALYNDITVKKVLYNCFTINEQCIIGLSTAIFNHDCKPNAAPLYKVIKNKHVMIIIALANIDPGQSITISYSEHVNHKGDEYYKKFHEFECNCERDKQQRTKIKDVCYKVAEYFIKRDQDVINNLVK